MRAIESANDLAISGLFDVESFEPFTLATLTGFSKPPSPLDTTLILEWLTRMSEPSSALGVIRAKAVGQTEYASEMNASGYRASVANWRASAELAQSEDLEWRAGGWDEACVHAVPFQRIAPLREILAKYWRCKGGHWIFVSGEIDLQWVRSKMRRPPHSAHDYSRLHAAFLRRHRLSSITFDDDMLDVYLQRPESDARSVLSSVVSEAGVDLSIDGA